jgi:trehalose 6-phosphate synthase
VKSCHFLSIGVLTALLHYKELLKSLCAYDLVWFQTIEDLRVCLDG